MGVSGDSESIVSGRVVNRKLSVLPLTIDLYSSRARFLQAHKTGNNVNQIRIHIWMHCTTTIQVFIYSNRTGRFLSVHQKWNFNIIYIIIYIILKYILNLICTYNLFTSSNRTDKVNPFPNYTSSKPSCPTWILEYLNKWVQSQARLSYAEWWKYGRSQYMNVSRIID